MLLLARGFIKRHRPLIYYIFFLEIEIAHILFQIVNIISYVLGYVDVDDDTIVAFEGNIFLNQSGAF